MSYSDNQEKISVSNTGKIATAAQADSATSASGINYSEPVVTLAPGVTGQNATTTTRTLTTYVQPPSGGGLSTTGVFSRQSINISHALSASNLYGSATTAGGLLIETTGYASIDDVPDTFNYATTYITGQANYNGVLGIGSLTIGYRPTTNDPHSTTYEYNNVYIQGQFCNIAGVVGGTDLGTVSTNTLISGKNITLNANSTTGGTQTIRFSTPTTVAYFNNTSTYAYKLAGTAWTVFSDARLKKNIRPVNNALDKIIALNPVHYEYINSGEGKYPTGTRTGFLAQEVEQVLPGHITEQEPVLEEDKAILGEGVNAKTLDADWIPYLVKATQELNTKLEQENLLLKQQLVALSARLDALEAK